MIKSFGKYIAKKITGTFAGKAVKYCFWSTLFFFGPGQVVAAVGVPTLAVVAVTAHSGVIEYASSKAIGKVL